MPDRATPFGAVSHSGGLPMSSNSLPSIDEEEIRGGVVGYEQIQPAVVIEVGGNHAPCFARIFARSLMSLTSVKVPSPLL